MCNTGDTVLYGTAGVCRCAGISEKEVNGIRNEYYVLKPIFNENSTIFVPTDNPALTARIRQVLSADEVYRLIHSMPDEQTVWIEDDTARKEQYRRILAGGDRAELVRLIKTLHLRGQTQKEAGRKMHAADERIMKEAEQMLHEEFAHVLHIKREQVLPLILEQMEGRAEPTA